MKRKIPTLIITLVVLLSYVLYGCASPSDPVTEESTGEETTVTESVTDAETEPEEIPEKMERYFIFRIWNFNERPEAEFKKAVDTALEAGFTAIKVHMPWHRIETADGSVDFSELDRMLDYVINVKGVKAAVSIDFARRYGDGMLSDDELQRNINGQLCVGDIYYNRAVLSFCSQSATDKAVSFYGRAVEHINEKFGKSIILYLPAFTQYCETEYWCTDQFDYSDNAVNAFRASLSEKFGDVSALNEATGKKFASFDEVEAPACSAHDALGVLWYNFRHDALKSFIDRLAAAQKKAAPDSKLAIQLGSVFDNASYLRCTLRFADLCENADVVWFDDAPLYDHKFSMDYVRSSLPEGVIIAQEIDGPRQYNASPEAYLDQGLTSFAYGATIVSAANWEIDEYFDNYRDVWRQIHDTWFGEEIPETVSLDGAPTQRISLADMLRRRDPSGFITKYRKALKNAPAVKITVVDDLR